MIDSTDIYVVRDRFLPNKYTKWYLSIIERRTLEEAQGYSERHHIIPRRLGGTNEPSNVVRLTAREHFICHRLLTKMTIGTDRKRMIFAAYALAHWRNTTRGSVKISSRTYDQLKRDLADARKTMPGHNLGRTWTPEQRAKMKNKSDRSAQFHRGRKRSEETKAKIKEKRALQVIKKKTWTLRNPVGEIIKTTGLKTFCQEHRLGLSKLLETEKTGNPVDRGLSKGWMILETVRS